MDLYFAQSCVGNYCYKKMGKKEMGNKQSGTKECKFNPSLQLLNARFSRKIAHCFFVKFVTWSNVLVLVSILFPSNLLV